MLRLNQVKIKTEHSRTQLVAKAAEILHVSTEDILDMKMIRRSVDARKKPDIFYSYSLDVTVKNEEKILHRFKGRENLVCKSVPVSSHYSLLPL